MHSVEAVHASAGAHPEREQSPDADVKGLEVLPSSQRGLLHQWLAIQDRSFTLASGKDSELAAYGIIFSMCQYWMYSILLCRSRNRRALRVITSLPLFCTYALPGTKSGTT